MKLGRLLIWMGFVGIVVAGVVVWYATQQPAAAQDPLQSRKQKTRSGETAGRPRVSFEGKLWDYLQSVQYQNWAPGPKQGLEPFRGKSPHGTYLKMYVNRIAAANPKSPPAGSMIVLENFGKDKRKLLFLNVMYRVKDYDPEHNDWYWIKYNPNGTVARTTSETGSKPISGKFKACIECHSKAKGGDFFYSNDK